LSTPLRHSGGLRLVAHRGAAAQVPENTLVAFRFALEHRAAAVECDVQKTHDGRYVLLHDDHIGRTGRSWPRLKKVKKLPVAQLDSVELRGRAEAAARYEFGSHKGPQFAGEPAALLEEFLDLIAGDAHPVLAMIELKAETLTPADARAIVRLVRAAHLRHEATLEGRVEIISFSEELCCAAADAMHRVGNHASMAGFICSKYPSTVAYDRLRRGLAGLLASGRALLHVDLKSVLKDKTGVRAADALWRGYGINVWTLHSSAEAEAVWRICPEAWLTVDDLDVLKSR